MQNDANEQTPSASVIVAAYNAAATVAACVESLLRLEYPADRLQIVCVDNGSSDATAAIDYDIAADVLDSLNIDVPDIDSDDLDDVDPWEEGDLGVLSDLGLPESVMSVIVGDTDLYADEQIGMIAARLGFADELSAVLDRLGH